eukprot:Nitzschia sp. Nitz4//scaffold19_size178191//132708//135718//NITZ4_002001-RA/size178191-processed-gene-0.304-mRNA-1//-1//CDS//3329540753//311//frame0
MTSPNSQKALRKRLATILRKPSNRVCSDCPDKATLACIIESPEGAPLGSSPLVAFVCFNCAGAHKGLGSHVSTVRNVALEDWEPHEVEAAEESGNKRVNAIYEATLKEDPVTASKVKPIKGAHNASRQRFVREKYVERRYYSKLKHFKLVEKGAADQNSPTKRQSLMVFLKNKRGGDDRSVLGFAADKSVADGTIGTAPESKDSRSVFQFQTKQLDHVLTSPGANTLGGPMPKAKRRSSIGPFFANFGKGASNDDEVVPPPPATESPNSFLSGSRGSIGTPGSWGLNGSDGFEGITKNDPVKLGNLEPGERFHHSHFSTDMTASGPESPSAPFEDPPPSKHTFEELRSSVLPNPTTPNLTRPKLLATKCMPSPANSRMTLYSNKSKSRGRSSSRVRDGGVREAGDTALERSSSKEREKSRSSTRGRSQSNQRHSHRHDDERRRRHRDRSGEHRGEGEHSKSRSRTDHTRSSKGHKSPSKQRTEKHRSSPSGSGRRSHRSPSKQRSENRHSSPSEDKRRSRSRMRSGDRDRDKSRSDKRSSRSSDPRPSGSRKSSDKPGRTSATGRSRSTSRLRQSTGSSGAKATREAASRRAARERSRSRLRGSTDREQMEDSKSTLLNHRSLSTVLVEPTSTQNTTGRQSSLRNLKPRSSSNVTVGSDEKSNGSSRHKGKPRSMSTLSVNSDEKTSESPRPPSKRLSVSSNNDGDGTASSSKVSESKTTTILEENNLSGVPELPVDKEFQLMLEGQEEAPLNDNIEERKTDSDEKPSNKADELIEGNNSQTSLSLNSVFSARSDGSLQPQKLDRRSTKYVPDGNDSFQVISAVGHKSFAFGTKAPPARSNSRPLAGVKEEAADLFLKSKKRISRGKAAEISAERTSRKSDIFASLDREDVFGDPETLTKSRAPPTRSRSGDARHVVMRRTAPGRSKSSANPRLDFSCTQITKPSDELNSKSTADFEQSFSLMEMLNT